MKNQQKWLTCQKHNANLKTRNVSFVVTYYETLLNCPNDLKAFCDVWERKAMGNIIVAIITGAFTLVGVIISNASSHRNFESTIKIAQAITDTKIDNLTQEVHKHNAFAERIPRIEAGLDDVERRISRLEE